MFADRPFTNRLYEGRRQYTRSEWFEAERLQRSPRPRSLYDGHDFTVYCNNQRMTPSARASRIRFDFGVPSAQPLPLPTAAEGKDTAWIHPGLLEWGNGLRQTAPLAHSLLFHELLPDGADFAEE